MNFDISPSDIYAIMKTQQEDMKRLERIQKDQIMPQVLAAYANTMELILNSKLVSAVTFTDYNATLTFLSPFITYPNYGETYTDSYEKSYNDDKWQIKGWEDVGGVIRPKNGNWQEVWKKTADPIMTYDKKLSELKSEKIEAPLLNLISDAYTLSMQLSGYYKTQFKSTRFTDAKKLKEYLYEAIPEIYEHHLLDIGMIKPATESKFKI